MYIFFLFKEYPTRFLTDALFTTITNANFNDQDILQKVDKGIVLKKQLLQKAASMNIHLPAYQEVTWGSTSPAAVSGWVRMRWKSA